MLPASKDWLLLRCWVCSMVASPPRPVCSMFRSILNLPSLPGQLPPCNKTRCWIIFTDALYTLYISKNKSFLQLESVNAIATREATSHSFTLRTRMGLKHHHFQWGVGLDQSYIGRNDFQKNQPIPVSLWDMNFNPQNKKTMKIAIIGTGNVGGAPGHQLV